MGNLGEGQDLYKLLKNLYNNPLICRKLYDKKVMINIYGSGSQRDDIKNLLLKKNKNIPNYKLSSIVTYKGLFKRLC